MAREDGLCVSGYQLSEAFFTEAPICVLRCGLYCAERFGIFQQREHIRRL